MLVTVANLKGGVGKSTLAVNLAAALANKRKVTLIDADAQATSSTWCQQGKVNLRAIALPLEHGRDVQRWTAAVLAEVRGSDAVVIDAPPHLAEVTQAALLLADLVLVPVTPSGADLYATSKALELLRQARTMRGDGLPRCLLVPAKVDRRTAAGREIEAALKPFGEPIGPAIGQRSAFVDSFTTGEAVLTYAPASKAAAEIEALARAVLKQGVR